MLVKRRMAAVTCGGGASTGNACGDARRRTHAPKCSLWRRTRSAATLRAEGFNSEILKLTPCYKDELLDLIAYLQSGGNLADKVFAQK